MERERALSVREAVSQPSRSLGFSPISRRGSLELLPRFGGTPIEKQFDISLHKRKESLRGNPDFYPQSVSSKARLLQTPSYVLTFYDTCMQYLERDDGMSSRLFSEVRLHKFISYSFFMEYKAASIWCEGFH